MNTPKLGLATLVAGISAPLAAQPVIVADSGDSAWVLAASALVMLAALPGLVLLNGRGRLGTTAFATIIATAIASLAFAAIGYSLAFGEGSNVLGGTGNAMLTALSDLRTDTTIPESVYALFQMVTAVLAVTILTSSIAERTRLGWLIPFAALWTLLVYTPVARWLWSGGWLVQLGALDFAGGIVVQTSAGVAALVIALLLGRKSEDEAAHEKGLVLGGVGLVWVGWFGIAGGAALAGGDDAASAIINAHLAASAGALVGLAVDRLRSGIFAPLGAANGAVAGLAAISAGAGFVAPLGAILVGIIGAFAMHAAESFVRKLDLGGTANAFVLNGSAGMIGALIFPVFILPAFGGPGLEDGVSLFSQLAAQAVAIAAITLWTAVLTAVASLMVSMTLPMRGTDSAG